jgi:hypothetical protein
MRGVWLKKRHQGNLSVEDWVSQRGVEPLQWIEPIWSSPLVFTAGNADTFSRALLSIKIVRKHHHCHLPAEVFHFSEEAPAKDDPVRSQLTEVNAVLVELSGVDKSKKRSKNASAVTQEFLDPHVWANVMAVIWVGAVAY